MQEVRKLTDEERKELRDTAMSMRMVPIGATFARLRRLVRDLGQQLGKDVRLRTTGDETESSAPTRFGSSLKVRQSEGCEPEQW